MSTASHKRSRSPEPMETNGKEKNSKRSVLTGVSVLNGLTFRFLMLEELARGMSVCKTWSSDVLRLPRHAFQYVTHLCEDLDDLAAQTSGAVQRHFSAAIRLQPGRGENNLQDLLLRCRQLPNLHTLDVHLDHWSQPVSYNTSKLAGVDLAPLRELTIENRGQWDCGLGLIVLAGRCSTLKTLRIDNGGMIYDLSGLRNHRSLTELDLEGTTVTPDAAAHILTMHHLRILKVATPFVVMNEYIEQRLAVDVATILAKHPSLEDIADVFTLETHLPAMIAGSGPRAPFRRLSLVQTQDPTASLKGTPVTILEPWKTNLRELRIEFWGSGCVSSDLGFVLSCSHLTSLTILRVPLSQATIDIFAIHLCELRQLHVERGILSGPITFQPLARLETLTLCALKYQIIPTPHGNQTHATKAELIDMLTSNPGLTELDIGGSFYEQADAPWGWALSDEMSTFAVQELLLPCQRLPKLHTLQFEFVCEC
jgi:hypothetical protein